MAVAGSVAVFGVVVAGARRLGNVKDLDDGSASGGVGSGGVDVRIRAVRHDEKVGRVWRDFERAGQVRAAVHHAGDESGSSADRASCRVVRPREDLRHGAGIQRLSVHAQCDAVVEAVQRDQHLGRSDAAIGAHDMVGDTLAGLDDQHVALVIELDGSRKGQTTSDFCSFPSACQDSLVRRVTRTGARSRNGCGCILGASGSSTGRNSARGGYCGGASCRCCQ